MVAPTACANGGAEIQPFICTKTSLVGAGLVPARIQSPPKRRRTLKSLPCVKGGGAARRRKATEPTAAGGGMKGGEVGAAVDKRKDQRQPAALVGHRKRNCLHRVPMPNNPPVGFADSPLYTRGPILTHGAKIICNP